MYALETWYVLYGHGICLLEMEYAVWTWYMSSGDGRCCMDMVYVFLTWNIFSWYVVRWYDMIFDDLRWYKMIWYDMMLFKTFQACVRLAAGAFFLEKTHILKKWYFLFLRKNDFCVFCIKNITFEHVLTIFKHFCILLNENTKS